MIKTDKQAAATSLYVALTVITQLKNVLFPFMPFSSAKTHGYLGFNNDISRGGWQWQDLPAGQALMPPQPLFKKLEESIIEEETKRIGT